MAANQDTRGHIKHLVREIEALNPNFSVPKKYEDPITLEIMTDPVIAADGHNYDRASITQILARAEPISPMTNLPVEHNIIIPNVNFRGEIITYLEEELKQLQQKLKSNQANAVPILVSRSLASNSSKAAAVPDLSKTPVLPPQSGNGGGLWASFTSFFSFTSSSAPIPNASIAPSSDNGPFKVIFVGDSGIGKTSLLCRIADNKQPEDFQQATIGVDFKEKTVTANGKDIKLRIWDTCGEERYRELDKPFYVGARVIGICFDLIDRKSFEHVKLWLQAVKSYADSRVKILLIGTKLDDLDYREVDSQEAANFAKEHNIPYFETSAKKGIGHDDVATAMALAAVEKPTNNLASMSFNPFGRK